MNLAAYSYHIPDIMFTTHDSSPREIMPSTAMRRRMSRMAAKLTRTPPDASFDQIIRFDDTLEAIAIEAALKSVQQSQTTKDTSVRGPDTVLELAPSSFNAKHIELISVPWASLSAAPEADPVILDQVEKTCPAPSSTGRDDQSHYITIQSEASKDPPSVHKISA